MSDVWLTIVLAGAGTYLLRASFLAFADRLVDLPPMVERVLRQIPPAVLAALVLPQLVRPEGSLDLWQPELLAGAIAAVVSWKTRNIAATLVTGMAVLLVMEQLV
ncbi:AzlD domain-containing protein [Actinospongicola halichondriae]|uniref:AzlD domain-containing protein n=1 Tax=Actinospongicola halichondriae TaxID=3236844 RepID=UPI003D3CBD8C